MHSGHILLSDFGCAKLLDQRDNGADNTDNARNPVQGELATAATDEDGNAQNRSRALKRRCSFVGTAQYVSPEVSAHFPFMSHHGCAILSEFKGAHWRRNDFFLRLVVSKLPNKIF